MLFSTAQETRGGESAWCHFLPVSMRNLAANVPLWTRFIQTSDNAQNVPDTFESQDFGKMLGQLVNGVPKKGYPRASINRLIAMLRWSARTE
jgi:hypothetical protein